MTSVQSERFDPKDSLVGQFDQNLEAIYGEQEQREAEDADSNFSNESFQRKKRATLGKSKTMGSKKIKLKKMNNTVDDSEENFSRRSTPPILETMMVKSKTEQPRMTV